jgi:GTP cyclohydrolase I
MKKKPNVEKLTYDLIRAIGDDPEREGLKKTPKRVRAAYDYLTQGYKQNVHDLLNKAVFHENYDEIVVVKDIDVFSLCEHHLLPFYGKCHVAYLPKGRIIGLSKIPRVVDMYARRLQVQERMTQQIANCLKEALQPLGVAVIIEATHLCMAMRGVEKQNAICVTSTMLGVFRSDRGTRMEFMELIKNSR